MEYFRPKKRAEMQKQRAIRDFDRHIRSDADQTENYKEPQSKAENTEQKIKHFMRSSHQKMQWEKRQEEKKAAIKQFVDCYKDVKPFLDELDHGLQRYEKYQKYLKDESDISKARLEQMRGRVQKFLKKVEKVKLSGDAKEDSKEFLAEKAKGMEEAKRQMNTLNRDGSDTKKFGPYSNTIVDCMGKEQEKLERLMKHIGGAPENSTEKMEGPSNMKPLNREESGSSGLEVLKNKLSTLVKEISARIGTKDNNVLEENKIDNLIDPVLKILEQYPNNLSTSEQCWEWHDKLNNYRKSLIKEENEEIQIVSKEGDTASKLTLAEIQKAMAKNFITLVECLEKEDGNADIQTVPSYLSEDSDENSLDIYDLSSEGLEKLEKATHRVEKIMSYNGSEVNEVLAGIASEEMLVQNFNAAIDKMRIIQSDIKKEITLKQINHLNIEMIIKRIEDFKDYIDDYENKNGLFLDRNASYYQEYDDKYRECRDECKRARKRIKKEAEKTTEEEELSEISKNLAKLLKQMGEKFDKIETCVEIRRTIPEAQKHIDNFQKFSESQQEELSSIKDYASYKNFIEVYKNFMDTFNFIKNYNKENEINVNDKVKEDLIDLRASFESLSNNFEKLAADTQKVRSEAKLTLNQLSERYGFSIGPTEEFKEEFKAKFRKHWRKVFEEYKDILKAKYNIETYEQYIDALNKKARELVKGTKLWTRRRFHTLDKILDRSLSVLEAGTNINSENRIEADKNLFGYPKDIHPTLRPVYCYLAEEPNDSDSETGKTGEVAMYGSVAILWKDHIKERMTVAMGDSLNQREKIKPAPYSSPDSGTFLLEDGNPLGYNRIDPYREGQIHGGTHIEVDIEAVYFTSPDESPSQEQVKRLNQLGVEVWVPCGSTDENSSPYKRVQF